VFLQDPAFLLLNSPSTILSSSLQQAQAPTTTPAFLSRFPRSLSSLSLGTKKKPDKEISSTSSTITDVTTSQTDTNLGTPTKNKKHSLGNDKTIKNDIPPPLPQRNILKKSLNHSIDDTDLTDMKNKRNTPISDLDQLIMAPESLNNSNKILNHVLSSSPGSAGKSKKRSKNKTKALSDPKMSSQTFLQMESRGFTSEPPPLPPRQPGLSESIPNFSQSMNNPHNSSPVNDTNNRPLPNSINTLMNYPLVATCAAVRDNISAAFPLSQRPNIVQQLQQQQQQQQLQQQQHQHHQKQHHNFHSNSKSPVSRD
jgi:Rho guanine nucleotide exchange factor 12